MFPLERDHIVVGNVYDGIDAYEVWMHIQRNCLILNCELSYRCTEAVLNLLYIQYICSFALSLSLSLPIAVSFHHTIISLNFGCVVLRLLKWASTRNIHEYILTLNFELFLSERERKRQRQSERERGEGEARTRTRFNVEWEIKNLRSRNVINWIIMKFHWINRMWSNSFDVATIETHAIG